MATESLRVLTVCTANVCRSPVAERLLHRHLADAGHAVQTRSAGTHGGGLRVHRDTVDAARLARIELTDHVSRRVTAEMLQTEGADLIVTMTREHLRHVIGLDPTVWPRAFTLRELARLVAEMPAGSTEWSWTDWLQSLGEGRDRNQLFTAEPADDLVDPFGGPASGHLMMVHDVDHLAAHIARCAPSPEGGAAPGRAG